LISDRVIAGAVYATGGIHVGAMVNGVRITPGCPREYPANVLIAFLDSAGEVVEQIAVIYC